MGIDLLVAVESFSKMVEEKDFLHKTNFERFSEKLISIVDEIKNEIKNEELIEICELINNFIDYDISEEFKEDNDIILKEQDYIYKIESDLIKTYTNIISHIKSIDSLIEYKSKAMQELITNFTNCNDLGEMIEKFNDPEKLKKLVTHLLFLNQNSSRANCYSHLKQDCLFAYTKEIIYFKRQFKSDMEKFISDLSKIKEKEMDFHENFKRPFRIHVTNTGLKNKSLHIIGILRLYCY